MHDLKMAEFEKSRWADSQFSKAYRDDADIYLPFRSLFIEMVKLFYKHFLSHKPGNKILDLGCGDGLFIHELLKSYSPEIVVLVDGSQEMLNAAKGRLKDYSNIQYVQASFQELPTKDHLSKNFDFIYSSLAIHHLSLEEKRDLYAYIYDHLSSGGYFVHYDVTLPPTETLEKWYLSLWKQWIKERSSYKDRKDLLGITEQYKGNPDNTPDTLESQMKAMHEIGFQNVDCFFKYGIFSLFGGSK